MYFTVYSQNTTAELFRTLIDLVQSKYIFIIIEEIPLPALSWDSKFRNRDHTTICEDFLLHRIEILYLHRTHKCIRRSFHMWVPRCVTLHQSTHHPACLDTIVGNRNMWIKLKRPAKDRAIKTDRRFRISDLDFKVGRGVHRLNKKEEIKKKKGGIIFSNLNKFLLEFSSIFSLPYFLIYHQRQFTKRNLQVNFLQLFYFKSL